MATQSLVVSSDPDILKALHPMMIEMGMGVEVCANSKGAFRSIRDRKFDTVIVDCDSDTSSLDLLSTLRRGQSNQRTVAVGITASYNNMKSLFDSGATFVLSKPLPLEDTRRILRISKGVLTRAVRRFLRLPVENLSTVTLGDHVEAIVQNISQGGIAIHAPHDLIAGQMIYASFLLPDTFHLIEGMCQVMWVEPGGRAGLEFRSLTDEARTMLQRWIKTRAKAANVEITDDGFGYEEDLNAEELQQTIHVENKIKMLWMALMGAAVDLLIVGLGTALFLALGMFVTDQPVLGKSPVILALSAGIVFWLMYRFLFYFFNVSSPGEKAVQRLVEQS